MEERWHWCVGIGEKQKRSHDDVLEQEPTRKRSKVFDSSVGSLKSQAKDYEEAQLKAKHSDTYIHPFLIQAVGRNVS